MTCFCLRFQPWTSASACWENRPKSNRIGLSRYLSPRTINREVIQKRSFMTKKGLIHLLYDFTFCMWFICNPCKICYSIQNLCNYVSMTSEKTRLDEFSHISIFPCSPNKEDSFSDVYIRQMFLRIVIYHNRCWLQSAKVKFHVLYNMQTLMNSIPLAMHCMQIRFKLFPFSPWSAV